MDQRNVSSLLINYFFGSIYFVMPVVGICLNVYVMRRLRKIAKLNLFRFEISSALPLYVMSICDSICLGAQLAQSVFHLFIKLRGTTSSIQVDDHSSVYLAAMFCKIDLYVIHATSTFSVWCWLVLSVMRFVAVFYPLRYRKIWRQPRDALTALVALGCLLQLWIPAVVSYEAQYASCYENKEPFGGWQLAQIGHLLDIALSYVIPAFARILLDGVVLCYCYRPNVVEVPVIARRYGISAPSTGAGESITVADELVSSEKSPMSGAHERLAQSVILTLSRQPLIDRQPQMSRRKHSMIKRSLIISAVNLFCNLPSHALRGLWTLDGGDQPLFPERYVPFAEGISQLLYFGQFTCNALYLSTTIYETQSTPVRCVVSSVRPLLSTTTNNGDAAGDASAV